MRRRIPRAYPVKRPRPVPSTIPIISLQRRATHCSRGKRGGERERIRRSSNSNASLQRFPIKRRFPATWMVCFNLEMPFQEFMASEDAWSPVFPTTYTLSATRMVVEDKKQLEHSSLLPTKTRRLGGRLYRNVTEHTPNKLNHVVISKNIRWISPQMLASEFKHYMHHLQ